MVPISIKVIINMTLLSNNNNNHRNFIKYP